MVGEINSKHNHVLVQKVKIKSPREMRSGTANIERKDGVALNVGEKTGKSKTLVRHQL